MRALTFLLLVAVMAVLMSYPSSVVDAKVCAPTNQALAWKHGGGYFQKLRSPADSGEWVEYDNKNGPGTRFTEILREGNQVVLYNPDRNVKILLRDDLAGIAQGKDEQQFQQLYQGTWMKVLDCT
jgi:hypothetical protein